MKITFTGLDAHTTRTEVDMLLADPRVELGVLWTADPDRCPRYPAFNAIARVLDWCGGRGALHVCGGRAREKVTENLFSARCLISRAGRIQINGRPRRDEVESVCHLYPDHTIITQHTEANLHLLAVDAPNHALLIDGSGGRGEMPVAWERPETSKAVGFAGGLGPDTIVDALSAIRRVDPDPAWIDMEGRIWTNDRFDLSKALEVLRLIGPS